MNISEIEFAKFLETQISCIHELENNFLIIKQIIDEILKARNNNRKIFIMGNGGSGSTASHFCADLLKTAIIKGENRFQAFSLADNNPVILAWSNDVSYDDIFVEQLKNLLSKNDVLIGFSGSGNSNNIVKAFQYGKKTGSICLGFTGESGGLMKKYCKICLQVKSDHMLTIESQHVLIFHCIIEIIRKTGKPLFDYK